MKTAIKLAKKSDRNQQHGAIVVKNGRVLGQGINSERNLPSDWIDASIISVHAEVAAIARVQPKNLKGATVYVARWGKCEAHLLSRPCPRCYEALKAAGVKRIIYTD